MDSQLSAMSIAASAMRAQGARLKITSENMANSESPSYQRKMIMFGVDTDKSERYYPIKLLLVKCMILLIL
jgi:flagellar basal-body rod protein FlgC